ncbi:MAG: ABC transporter substrate-binding protein, partial [Clostridia bacterium]|nr:ABC transporter substrate-binding protein [Clostridia bacterium]
MKSISKILALLLAVLMCVAVFASCNQNTPKDTGAETGTGPAPAPAGDKTLVVGYSPFSSKFSPFFSETAYDQDAYAMTQLGLLTSDRTGAIILKGIEGETKEYNGTDYTYYGPADLTITENEDGTVYYDFKLRDDLKFSDGEKLTVDDVIFSMYVLCDPMYDGSSTLFAQPIEGMDAYRAGVASLYNLLVTAGPDNDNFDLWDEAAQTKFWESSDAAFKGLAQDIVDY